MAREQVRRRAEATAPPPEAVVSETAAAAAARRPPRRIKTRAAEALHEAITPVPPVTEFETAAVPVPARNNAVAVARAAGARVGSGVRYVRELEAEDIVSTMKNVVRRHPASLLAAAAAGFLFGRVLRGR